MGLAIVVCCLYEELNSPQPLICVYVNKLQSSSDSKISEVIIILLILLMKEFISELNFDTYTSSILLLKDHCDHYLFLLECSLDFFLLPWCLTPASLKPREFSLCFGQCQRRLNLSWFRGTTKDFSKSGQTGSLWKLCANNHFSPF